MNKNISKITGYFQFEKLKNDKRIVVFSVCLLIATILWFLNALSKDYSTTLSYPVKYINPPKNQFLSNTPPANFDLQVEAHGFTLLRHKLSLSFSPIVLNLNNITRDLEVSNGKYNVQTSSLLQRIKNQVSSEISVSSIRPDVITIVLDSLKTKLVPVKLNATLDFKPQFNLKEPISIEPEMVEITGPAITIDTIYILQTEQKQFEKLNTDIERNLTIIHPENTNVHPEKIKVKIPVEKFTEKELKVPIQLINKPENVIVKLFPSEVKISILTGLSEFENISPDNFKVIADYNSITTTSENLKVTLDSKPSFVDVIRFSPGFVEFLIETK